MAPAILSVMKPIIAMDETAVDTTYARLRSDILSEELSAGAPFSQVQIAKRVGVSRTVLREALRRLQQEGLVEAPANRRVRVASFSPEDLEELYTLRLINEALAVSISVPHLTGPDKEILAGHQAEIMRLGSSESFDWERSVRAGFEQVIKYAGPRHLRIVRELIDHSARYRKLLMNLDPNGLRSLLKDQLSFLEACIAGAAPLARERHIARLSKHAMAAMMIMAPAYEPAKLRAAIRAVHPSASMREM